MPRVWVESRVMPSMNPPRSKGGTSLSTFNCRRCGHCCLTLVDAYQGCVSDGDLERWRHSLNRRVIYTPGVRFVADRAATGPTGSGGTPRSGRS